MVEEQFRLGITDKLGDLFAQLGVGNADRFDHCHDDMPFSGDLDGRSSADALMKIVRCAISAWQELR